MVGILKATSPSAWNTRIELQVPTKAPDGMGGWPTVYVTKATVPAKKTTHRSDEAVQAMATTGTAIHNFRIRWRSDVRSSWKVKEGFKLMNIIGPPVMVREGLLRYLDITVKEAA